MSEQPLALRRRPPHARARRFPLPEPIEILAAAAIYAGAILALNAFPSQGEAAPADLAPAAVSAFPEWDAAR